MGSRRTPRFKTASLPQGNNAVTNFIPVARIADMLENSRTKFDYNGQRLTYPDIELIYWSGGNPFHHHQDINRLRKAWSKPETVIVNEISWTTTARQADIVFPCTMPLEREDFAVGSLDAYITPMHPAVKPHVEAKDDYAIFAGLAQRLGFAEAFTEGRSAIEWVEYLYNETRRNASKASVTLPPFSEFWRGQQLRIKDRETDLEVDLEKFRRDPDQYPLGTPSGRIEIFSETIAGFHYDDCVGHPCWFAGEEWLGVPRAQTYPFHLISQRMTSAANLGITGYSYGGFMSALLSATTNRFQAAVTVSLAADWLSLYFSTMIPRFVELFMGGLPCERPQDYVRRSPVTSMRHCRCRHYADFLRHTCRCVVSKISSRLSGVHGSAHRQCLISTRRSA